MGLPGGVSGFGEGTEDDGDEHGEDLGGEFRGEAHAAGDDLFGLAAFGAEDDGGVDGLGSGGGGMGTAAAEDAEEIVFEVPWVLALLFGAAFETAEDDWGDLGEDAGGVFAGEAVLGAELVFHGAAVVTVEVVEESHGVSWLERFRRDDWHKLGMVRAESWGGKRAGDVTGGRGDSVHGGQNE